MEIPEKNKANFQMCIKASFSGGNHVEFDIGDTALIVADNHNPEQETFTTTKDDTFPNFSGFPDFRTYFLDFRIFMNLSDLQKGLG